MRENKDYKDIRQARKSGGSIIIPLTGFVQDGKFYKIEGSGNQVILTVLDV